MGLRATKISQETDMRIARKWQKWKSPNLKTNVEQFNPDLEFRVAGSGVVGKTPKLLNDPIAKQWTHAKQTSLQEAELAKDVKQSLPRDAPKGET